MEQEEEKVFTVNLMDLQVKNLRGSTVVSPKAVVEGIGEAMYSGLSGLRWLNVAQMFFDGEPVQLKESQLLALINFFKSDNCELLIMVKVPLLSYLEKLKQ